MTFADLLLDVADVIAQVTINRPKALNALNSQTITELQQVFNALEQDSSVEVIILTGSGEKSFVAGADISQMQEMNALEARDFARMGQGMLKVIENHSKPVIAAVNG